MAKRTVVTFITLLALAIGATTVVAQTAELTGEPLLRALLEEMRAFRVSMQKTSAYEIRGRLLIDRARLHQETIRELSREVENYAEMIRSGEPLDFNYEMAMEMESVEARAAGVPNPDDRKRMIERQKEAMDRRREMHARHMEQNRIRHQRMEIRLAEERDKLEAIEEELAQIQRELTGATR